MCGAQLLVRIEAAVLAAQPLAVKQVGAGQLDADPGPAEPLDRLGVQGFGFVVRAEQRLAPGP